MRFTKILKSLLNGKPANTEISLKTTHTAKASNKSTVHDHVQSNSDAKNSLSQTTISNSQSNQANQQSSHNSNTDTVTSSNSNTSHNLDNTSQQAVEISSSLDSLQQLKQQVSANINLEDLEAGVFAKNLTHPHEDQSFNNTVYSVFDDSGRNAQSTAVQPSIDLESDFNQTLTNSVVANSKSNNTQSDSIQFDNNQSDHTKSINYSKSEPNISTTENNTWLNIGTKSNYPNSEQTKSTNIDELNATASLKAESDNSTEQSSTTLVEYSVNPDSDQIQIVSEQEVNSGLIKKVLFNPKSQKTYSIFVKKKDDKLTQIKTGDQTKLSASSQAKSTSQIKSTSPNSNSTKTNSKPNSQANSQANQEPNSQNNSLTNTKAKTLYSTSSNTSHTSNTVSNIVSSSSIVSNFKDTTAKTNSLSVTSVEVNSVKTINDKLVKSSVKTNEVKANNSKDKLTVNSFAQLFERKDLSSLAKSSQSEQFDKLFSQDQHNDLDLREYLREQDSLKQQQQAQSLYLQKQAKKAKQTKMFSPQTSSKNSNSAQPTNTSNPAGLKSTKTTHSFYDDNGLHYTQARKFKIDFEILTDDQDISKYQGYQDTSSFEVEFEKLEQDYAEFSEIDYDSFDQRLEKLGKQQAHSSQSSHNQTHNFKQVNEVNEVNALITNASTQAVKYIDSNVVENGDNDSLSLTSLASSQAGHGKPTSTKSQTSNKSQTITSNSQTINTSSKTTISKSSLASGGESFADLFNSDANFSHLETKEFDQDNYASYSKSNSSTNTLSKSKPVSTHKLQKRLNQQADKTDSFESMFEQGLGQDINSSGFNQQASAKNITKANVKTSDLPSSFSTKPRSKKALKAYVYGSNTQKSQANSELNSNGPNSNDLTSEYSDSSALNSNTNSYINHNGSGGFGQEFGESRDSTGFSGKYIEQDEDFDWRTAVGNISQGKANTASALSQQALRAQRKSRLENALPTKKDILMKQIAQQDRAQAEFTAGEFISDINMVFTEYNYREARFIRPELDTNVATMFRKSMFEVQLLVDLHGLTREEAKETIKMAINSAKKNNEYTILFMTGHGKQILKQAVPNWLIQHSYVVAFKPARDVSDTNGFVVLLKNYSKEDKFVD